MTAKIICEFPAARLRCCYPFLCAFGTLNAVNRLNLHFGATQSWRLRHAKNNANNLKLMHQNPYDALSSTAAPLFIRPLYVLSQVFNPYADYSRHPAVLEIFIKHQNTQRSLKSGGAISQAAARHKATDQSGNDTVRYLRRICANK